MKKSTPRKSFLEKILTPAQIKKIKHAAGNKMELVFTNGVFDLLHPGHVRYLEQAKKQGTHLVVALNSDASTKRLGKGPNRPINKLRDRQEVIAALEMVDFVTSFTQDTPLKTILAIQPDVLTKGGDYSIAQMVGAKEVLGWGGRVKPLTFVKNKSTTQIIKKMR